LKIAAGRHQARQRDAFDRETATMTAHDGTLNGTTSAAALASLPAGARAIPRPMRAASNPAVAVRSAPAQLLTAHSDSYIPSSVGARAFLRFGGWGPASRAKAVELEEARLRKRARDSALLGHHAQLENMNIHWVGSREVSTPRRIGR